MIGPKASGWAKWRSSKGGITVPKTDAKGWTGIVGRQSKSTGGKQGIHHHPMEIQLGRGLAGGMKPGGFVPYKKPSGY